MIIRSLGLQDFYLFIFVGFCLSDVGLGGSDLKKVSGGGGGGSGGGGGVFGPSFEVLEGFDV